MTKYKQLLRTVQHLTDYQVNGRVVRRAPEYRAANPARKNAAGDISNGPHRRRADTQWPDARWPNAGLHASAGAADAVVAGVRHGRAGELASPQLQKMAMTMAILPRVEL